MFESKAYPDKSTKDDGVEENRIALTTTELAEYYKEKRGKSITTDNIKKTYLAELENNASIDKIESKVDRRRDIYYPIVGTASFKNIRNCTNLDEKDNNLQYSKLKLSSNYTKIDEKWLEIEIPIKDNGIFDIEAQRNIVNQYKPVQDIKQRIEEIYNEITSIRVSNISKI